MAESIADMQAEICRLKARNKKLDDAARTARRSLVAALSSVDAMIGNRRGCVDPDVATMEAVHAARKGR